MYPTIHNFDANPLLAYPAPGGSSAPSGSSATQPPPPQQQQPRPAANGPPPAAPPAFPTLQVTIDPRFQVAPPIRAPSQPPGQGGPAAGSAPPPPPGQPAPGSRPPLDLELERRLVRELAPANGSSGGSDASGPSSSGSSMQTAREDPYDVLLARYTGMGYSRDEAAMALAIVGTEAGDDADRIVDTCRKFKKLCSMGFRAEHVAGALIMHEGDLDQATNTCLDASG